MLRGCLVCSDFVTSDAAGLSGFRNKRKEVVALSGFFCYRRKLSIGPTLNPATQSVGHFLGWKIEPEPFAGALPSSFGLTGKEKYADPSKEPSLEGQ